jgi:hypothetical protein
MELDTRIPLQVKPIQIDSPLEVQGRMLTLKNLATQGQIQQATLQENQRKIQEQSELANIYRSSVGPDGTPNHVAIIQGMASRGLGHLIPAYRKSMLEADEKQAEVGTKQFKLAKDRLDASGAAISSLLQMPDVNHDHVVQTVSGLVSRGLMDQDSGAKLVRSMPGDPAQLRGWLTQKGLEVMDHSKRMEMLTPNFQQLDTGGVIQTGTVDPLTGQYTKNGQITKTNTPGEILQAGTTRRGQDIQAGTTQRGQDMTAASAAAGHDISAIDVKETPTGLVRIDKRTGKEAPVMGTEGTQVQQAKSPLFDATQRKARMGEYITQARELLPKATGSGVGSAIDTGLSQVGVATAGGEAASQLDLIGGWMMLNVPRFEGPQSNQDTNTYKTMAAQVGDSTVPVSRRLKALETLEELTKKIPDINSTRQTPEGKPRPPLSAFGGKKPG